MDKIDFVTGTSFKTDVKRNKEFSFDVTFSGMSAGELMALESILKKYGTSLLGETVYESLKNAMNSNPEVQEVIADFT